jgi:hypothetical protein
MQSLPWPAAVSFYIPHISMGPKGIPEEALAMGWAPGHSLSTKFRRSTLKIRFPVHYLSSNAVILACNNPPSGLPRALLTVDHFAKLKCHITVPPASLFTGHKVMGLPSTFRDVSSILVRMGQ